MAALAAKNIGPLQMLTEHGYAGFVGNEGTDPNSSPYRTFRTCKSEYLKQYQDVPGGIA